MDEKKSYTSIVDFDVDFCPELFLKDASLSLIF